MASEMTRNICDTCATPYVVGPDYAPHRCDLDAVRADVEHWRQAERTVATLGHRTRASLRVFREQIGLSLRETARLAGVSPAALSTVERNPVDPALGSDSVARVLDVLLAYRPLSTSPAPEGGEAHHG